MPTHANNFVVKRALKAGGDSRFDEVKHQPARFTFFWMGQGTFLSSAPQSLADRRHTATWVMIVGLPVYLVSSLSRIYEAFIISGIVTCEIKVPRKVASGLAHIDMPVDVSV